MNVNLRIAVDGDNDVEHGQGPAMGVTLRVTHRAHHRVAVDGRVVGLENQLNPDKELLLFLSRATAGQEGARQKQHDREPSRQ